MAQSRTFKAGILASGTALTTVARLIALAVLARVLSVHDYATYRQTFLAYAFVAPLLVLGLPQALTYFLPAEQGRPRAVLHENLVLLTVMGGLFSLFLLLGGNRLLASRFHNPDLARTLLILAPYPLFMLPAGALSACLMARDRTKQVVVFNLLSRLATLGVVIAVCLTWRTPGAAIRGTVITAAIVLLPALALMRASCQGEEWRPTASGMWAQMKYSVPLGLAALFGTLSLSLDRVIVAAMCTPEEFALYANGAVKLPLIDVITLSVVSVLLPDLRRLFSEGRPAEALALWKRSARKCALIVFPMTLLFLCMAPEIMTALFSDKYMDSAVPFRIYLALLPMRVVSFSALIMVAGKSHLLLVRAVGELLLNVLLSISLVHLIGYVGAAIATVITFYFWTVPFSTVAIGRAYKVRVTTVFPYHDLFRVFLSAGLACIVFVPHYLLDIPSPFVRLAVFAPSYIGLACLLASAMGLVDWRSFLGGRGGCVRR